MKANELMVGDYVYNHRNWECPIVEIYKNSAVVIAKHYGEEEFLLSDLRPIPLTPEILEKNGFKLKEEETGMYGVTTAPHYICDGVPFEVFCDGEPFAIWFKEPVNIKFVHELQDVLRLCGISKEIEL